MPLISSVGAVKSSVNSARCRDAIGSPVLGPIDGFTPEKLHQAVDDDLFEKIPSSAAIIKQGVVEKVGYVSI